MQRRLFSFYSVHTPLSASPETFAGVTSHVSVTSPMRAGDVFSENVVFQRLDVPINDSIMEGDGAYNMNAFDNNYTSVNDTQVYYEVPVKPEFDYVSKIRVGVLSGMFVIAVIGNTATLVQMFRMRRRKSTINTLILQLAIADLWVSFFCNVTEAVWGYTVQWLAGNGLCKLLKFLQVFGLYLSTYIVVIIAIDRCFAILDPMSKNNAPKRVRYMILIAWILSALFSSPQLYIFRLSKAPFWEDYYQCVSFGAYSAPWQEAVYSCFSALMMFLLPLATMVTAYMLIFCTIAKKSRDLQKEEDTSRIDMLGRGPVRSELFRKAKVKSLRMTTLIVFAFIVCWSPYWGLFLNHTLFNKKGSQAPAAGPYMWIFFFGMANSMVNPMIYGAFHICKRKRRGHSWMDLFSWTRLQPVYNTRSRSKSNKSKRLGSLSQEQLHNFRLMTMGHGVLQSQGLSPSHKEI